jgi:uncharacterized protein (TIGR03437 family)
VDATGDIYIADANNSRIRKVTPDGTISTVAGSSTKGYSGDGGPATSAFLNGPVDVVPDAAGNLFIVDQGNNVVRKVDTNGIITTVAGNGSPGYSGDGGPATAASLNGPTGVAVNAAGNLFISDRGNNRIRKVSNGIITTVAGTGRAGYAGDGDLATSAELNAPTGISLDASGNLYIAEVSNNRIRVLLTNGTIETVAGNGSAGFSGDGGTATSGAINGPRGVTTFAGLVYIGDALNNRIRLLTPAFQAPAITQVTSSAEFGSVATIAPGSWIEIHGAGLASDSRGWNSGDFSGANAPTTLDGTSVSIGGQAAYIEYISPGQVNTQVPSGVPTGPQQVTVTSSGGTSAPFAVTLNPSAPGLFAPSSLAIGGTQYSAAYFASNLTPVFTPGDILSSGSLRMKPGDTIILYGIGFGPVTPDSPAGQIVQQANTLATPPQFSFGGVPATLVSAGLVSGAIGLYQFNVTVPSVTSSDAVPLTFTLGGVAGTQTLYIATGN